jgi:X-Prolyl dipeptidyl aminopeptidase PepX, N-terminal.
MQFNHFSIIDKSFDQELSDLASLGFKFDTSSTAKVNLKNWLLTAPIAMTSLAATDQETISDFLDSETPLTWDIFYAISLQLLDFVANFDFQLAEAITFANSINLPLVDLSAKTSAKQLISAIYLLMNSRRRTGMTLVEHWVSEGLLPLDNHYHFFNDKSLATFDTSQLIREVVYVESSVDTQNRGEYDLVKVEIIRPLICRQATSDYDGKSLSFWHQCQGK